MTFQPCRPATIKLLPYGGAHFVGPGFFFQFLPHMGRTESWEKTLKKCGDDQSDGRERKKNFTDFVIYITQDLWYTLL